MYVKCDMVGHGLYSKPFIHLTLIFIGWVVRSTASLVGWSAIGSLDCLPVSWLDDRLVGLSVGSTVGVL